MFFTRIGLLIAHVGFWMSIIYTGIALLGALTTDSRDMNIAFAKRYLGTLNTGEALDKGMLFIVAFVILGILCKISRKR